MRRHRDRVARRARWGRRLLAAAAAASGSAVCGAAVLGAWFALTPCFGSMGLLLIGLAALHACPSWPVWTLGFGGYFIRHRTTRLV